MLELETDQVPEVEVRRRRGPSIVWLIPLVAGVIAIWLAYITIREQGPTITIDFETAEGLEAGQTTVKYKDVEVGLVEEVALSDDLSHIVVTASMVKAAESYMNEGTRFWIVRPRIGAGGVSGLGTLVSGAFIEVDPGEGEATTSFVGLEEPPPIRSNVPGTRFVLEAAQLGSIDRGSPVYYRDLRVGQVLGYELAEDNQEMTVQIFVNAPHDRLVRPDSRFWNASGIDVELGAGGVNVSVASLQTLLMGGVAFDTPDIDQPGERAPGGTAFKLFDGFQAVTEAGFTRTEPYLVYFDGSVRGLSPGAPVELRGIKVGRVTDVELLFDVAENAIRIPVTLEFQPQRLAFDGPVADEPYQAASRLVERGLRAQLRTGNVLTGEMVVALDFFPGAPPAELRLDDTHPVIPTVPTEIEVITASITEVLNKIAALPIDDVAADLRQTVQSIEALASSPRTEEAVTALGDAAVGLQALVSQAEATLASADGLIGDESQLRYDTNEMVRELTAAARSIRLFADYLERHPEALIRGRGP